MDANLNRIIDCDVTGIPVRVSVSLGMSSDTLQRSVSLPPGEVIELNRRPSDCVYIYVDGVLYAEATLQVVDGSWAAQIDTIMIPSRPDFLDIISPEEEPQVEQEETSLDDTEPSEEG